MTRRPRWAARLGAWLCLLALAFSLAAPVLHAAAAADLAQTRGFICHSGIPADRPAAPDDQFPDCSHCPLCQLTADAALLAPPQPAVVPAPPPRPAALERPAIAELPVRPAAATAPLQPRAPPAA